MLALWRISGKLVDYMYGRLLAKPKHSILLLGPRGTGKSTWIREHFAKAPQYDLLNTSEALRLSRNPELLFQELSHLPPHSWAVVDEVQKVPALLDQAQRLMEECGIRLVLSGSSARKLKRSGVNLLAGRARVTHMHPLVYGELGEHLDVDQRILYGGLPLAVTSDDPPDYLHSYTETYIREEIQAEALTRNIGNFSRFLEIAARQNGQLTNATSIGRDAQVSRQTVQTYFDILIDTLIGYWVKAWRLKSTTKQVSHPKFYFFDSGVARALSGRLPYPPTQEELGALVETYIYSELRAYLDYTKKRYPFYFWRSYDGVEVDFLCETIDGFRAIEIKASRRWERRFGRGMVRLRDDLGKERVKAFGIFQGERSLNMGEIQVYTVSDFLARLWDGNIIP